MFSPLVPISPPRQAREPYCVYDGSANVFVNVLCPRAPEMHEGVIELPRSGLKFDCVGRLQGGDILPLVVREQFNILRDLIRGCIRSMFFARAGGHCFGKWAEALSRDAVTR